MGTWVKKSFWLDPWSYQNLLRKAEWLKQRNEREGGRRRANGKGEQPTNPAVALRYILRNLRFDSDLLSATPTPTHQAQPRRESAAQRILRKQNDSAAEPAAKLGPGKKLTPIEGQYYSKEQEDAE
jgi:hypothetical protein